MNKVTKVQIIKILNEIANILEKENIPLTSVKINFKDLENLVFDNQNKKLDNKNILNEPKFDCTFCGNRGTLGICCNFK